MKYTVSVAVVLYEYSVCMGPGWCGGALERKNQFVLLVDIMCIERL